MWGTGYARNTLPWVCVVHVCAEEEDVTRFPPAALIPFGTPHREKGQSSTIIFPLMNG